MSFTKILNGKQNLKRTSNADLPFSPKFPVLNRYIVDSTLNQTVINYGFTVDTINAKDSLCVYVDGKLLTEGAANDYQFTSVDVLGLSSQVTLNLPIAANLNIQVLRLGVKKEIEFQQDQRFTNLYEAQDQGFQAFVRTSQQIVATTTTGAPAAGTFYSDIVNRKPIIDLSQDLKARFGNDRFHINTSFRLQDEFGASGQQVWGVPNDQFNQVRFVGNGWTNINTSNGQSVETTVTNDFVEIVFYGTQLNLLCRISGTRDFRAAVDGGTEGSALPGYVGANVYDSRNPNANQVISVASGLTLGVHTVRIRNNAVGGLTVMGFEASAVATTPVNVLANPGVAYTQGKKVTSSVQNLVSYLSGVNGTRGGRVVRYLNQDGTYGTAFRAVNASQANLTSADHTNEEVARPYYWREFASNRTDDFSTSFNTQNRMFTLEDGTTTLVGLNVTSGSAVSAQDSLYPYATNAYINLTFVGTGLDIITNDQTAGTRDNNDFFINGTSIGSLSGTASTNSVRRTIVSGLPYGTHTFRMVRTAVGNVALGISQFIVYQPKKPVVPAGVIEISDFNVLADYSGATITGTGVNDNFQMPTGSLYKFAGRELAYQSGSWVYNAAGSPNPLGTTISNTGSEYFEHRFFGTGVLIHSTDSSGGAFNIQVQINGALNATGVARSNMSNAGGGTYTITTGVGSQPARVDFTGLTLGWHTIRVNKSSGTAWNMVGLGIITPVHSYASNLPYDLQNALPVGSQSVSDLRLFSPVKSTSPAKNIAQAFGVQSDPSTSSTVFVPMPDMSVVHSNKTGKVRVNYSFYAEGNSTNGGFFVVYMDGQPVGQEKQNSSQGTGYGSTVADCFVVIVSPGVHKFDIYWRTSGSSYSGTGQRRNLLVEEVE